MTPTLAKALVLAVPIGLLFSACIIHLLRWKTAGSFLQLMGAGFLGIVVLTHVCEGVQLLPWMGWGVKGTAGHYLDLASAVLGLVLLPAGYFLHGIGDRKTPRPAG